MTRGPFAPLGESPAPIDEDRSLVDLSSRLVADVPDEWSNWGDPREEASNVPGAAFGPRRIAAPAGMTELDQLLAYEQIRQLAARYALAVDARDIDALVELFVEDVEGARGRRGRDVLHETFTRSLRAQPVTFLQVGGHVITLQDHDNASGTVHCRAEVGGAEEWIHQLIVYEDTYQRRRDAWYFVRRNHLLLYGATVTPSPLAQAPANWPKSQIGRGAVPDAWGTWQAFQLSDR